MEILKSLIKQMIGMFVDDGSLALAILLVTGSAAVLALCFQATGLAAIVLLVGCLFVLSENVVRSARRDL
jgi:hypothetical protein